VAATEIAITATASASQVTVAVRNTDDGMPAVASATGTGLARLRERLGVLYGDAAALTSGATNGGAYEAVLVVPRRGSDA
jgi:LytS/YehU family sensor histidine kinase